MVILLLAALRLHPSLTLQAFSFHCGQIVLDRSTPLRYKTKDYHTHRKLTKAHQFGVGCLRTTTKQRKNSRGENPTLRNCSLRSFLSGKLERLSLHRVTPHQAASATENLRSCPGGSARQSHGELLQQDTPRGATVHQIQTASSEQHQH